MTVFGRGCRLESPSQVCLAPVPRSSGPSREMKCELKCHWVEGVLPAQVAAGDLPGLCGPLTLQQLVERAGQLHPPARNL